MSKYNPWSLLLVFHLGLLALANYWRESAGYDSFGLLKGSLPNLLAVPILCFGLMMFIYIERRQEWSHGEEQRLKRNFRICLIVAIAVNVGWELIQVTGNLVFDGNDLLFVGLGAILTLVCFKLLRPFHFKR